MSAPLANRHLASYLAGNFISIIGTWAQRVVVFWLGWELTHSTAFLGTLALLDLRPSVLTAPIAGTLADRHPGRVLARNVQFLSALPPLAMIAVASFGTITPAALMLLTLAGGVLGGLDHPLRLLLVGSIVPRDQIARAVAANSVAFNVGRMIGPALGGWVVYLERPALVFGYNAISFLIFTAVLAALTLPDAPGNRRAARPPRIGWAAVARSFDRPLLLIVAQFATIAALIRPVFELLPGFSDGLAQGGMDAAQVFSALTSAQGFGAILGALVAARLMRRMRFQTFGTLAGLVAALATLLFLASGGFGAALACLALMAGAVLANGIATQVALQTGLPETVRGKALSLYTMTMRGMPAAGALLFGTLAEVMPLRLLCAGLALLMLVLSTAVLAGTRR